MKALSIKQPWASLIVHGIKDIENRTWKTNYRGRIYIHSSIKEYSIDRVLDQDQLNCVNSKWEVGNYPDMPASAIIGEVDILDCVVNYGSVWAEKSTSKTIYNWVLKNAEVYDQPILNIKGKLSLWEY